MKTMVFSQKLWIVQLSTYLWTLPRVWSGSLWLTLKSVQGRNYNVPMVLTWSQILSILCIHSFLSFNWFFELFVWCFTQIFFRGGHCYYQSSYYLIFYVISVFVLRLEQLIMLGHWLYLINFNLFDFELLLPFLKF